MKIDKLLGLTDLKAPFDDPFEIFYGEETGKKKKKKKKDRDEDSGGGSFKDSLKEMSKKELVKMADKMGIDLDFVDRQDKKAMRKAILKAHKGAKTTSAIKMVGGNSDKLDKHKSVGLQLAESDVPFYFDEDSRDFVIRNADTAEDITCYDAMRSLGHMRKSKRSDDGFGTMMAKLDQLIKMGALDEKKPENEPIDVDYTVVDADEPKAIELTPEQSKQIVDEIDRSLEARKKAKQK